MKGKNFSTNNATGKRRKGDLHETPYSMTSQPSRMCGYDDAISPDLSGIGGYKNHSCPYLSYDIDTEGTLVIGKYGCLKRLTLQRRAENTVLYPNEDKQ
jgi:hypothetical protein